MDEQDVTSNVDSNRREKVKEMMRNNFDSAFPHEIIEFLLCQNSKVEDISALAHAVMDTFHTFDCVLDASFEALMAIPGMDNQSALLICSLKGIFKIYLKNREDNRELTLDTLSDHYQNLIGYNVDETLIVTCFDLNKKVRREFHFTNNSPTCVDIAVNNVVSEIVKTKAPFATVAHNHPNGIVTPSEKDIHFCVTLYKRLQLLHIGLADFMIISDKEVFSFFTALKERRYKGENLTEKERLLASAKSILIDEEELIKNCENGKSNSKKQYSLYNINGKIVGSDGDDFDGFYDKCIPQHPNTTTNHSNPTNQQYHNSRFKSKKHRW